jgi:hypothetical protein
VIVHDLNIVCIPFTPNEAETPLVVDSDAIFPCSVAVQSFQAISGRRNQVSQFRGAVQLPKLPARDMLDGLKASDRLPMVKSPGFGGAERLDHDTEHITYSV